MYGGVWRYVSLLLEGFEASTNTYNRAKEAVEKFTGEKVTAKH